jgi:hypothetical protein
MPLMDVQRHSSEIFKRSVHYRTVHAWNDLPKDLDFESLLNGDKKIQSFKQCVSNNLIARRND